jgi:hypothetical protein
MNAMLSSAQLSSAQLEYSTFKFLSNSLASEFPDQFPDRPAKSICFAQVVGLLLFVLK